MSAGGCLDNLAKWKRVRIEKGAGRDNNVKGVDLRASLCIQYDYCTKTASKTVDVMDGFSQSVIRGSGVKTR